MSLCSLFTTRRPHRVILELKSSLLLTLIALVLLAPVSAWALEIIVGLPYGTHRIGHTAVRVSPPGKREVIYDFGRYGRVWGPLRMQGEGIMRVWRGRRQVRRYLQKQMSYRDSIGYDIAVSPEEEQRVYRYYEDLLANARWSRPGSLHKRYRLAEDYDGVFTQCTSVALNGLKHVWPRERWERLLDPRFNVGQGFKRRVREYYFRSQRERSVNETVVPLDVIDSFRVEERRENSLITRVNNYRRRR